MINNWQIPRNKRKLHAVVDILSLFVLHNLGEVWNGDLERQLDFEAELERYGIKGEGQRRDRKAGGARTYEAWLSNLGLIYEETNTGIIRTTLAGEALLSGHPPVPIITNQLMKMQYPSPYSIRRNVEINEHFQIRPFRFLIRLLRDSRIQKLSKQEIGRLVITLGKNETSSCYEHVVQCILNYRKYGEVIFEEIHAKNYMNTRNLKEEVSYLEDIANVFINYLEYTQIIVRDIERHVYICPDKLDEVKTILNDSSRVRPFDNERLFGREIFQRSYGVVLGQTKDNRNFYGQVITDIQYRDRRIRSELLHLATRKPIMHLTAELIEEIAISTGYTQYEVEEALERFRPDTLSAFETSYLNMAINGREQAVEFEVATQNIFEQLGFKTEHTGNRPLYPDIFVKYQTNYSGIIDTKASRQYSISNDHRNRMIHNYISMFQNQNNNMEFFMYVADSFGNRIDDQIQSLAMEAGINGCAITAYNLIKLLQRHLLSPIPCQELRELFQVNRHITVNDIDSVSSKSSAKYQVYMDNKSNKIKCLFRMGELFCGAGGMSIAAKFTTIETDKEVFKVEQVWANDYDEAACATFRHNICPDRPESVICGDVQELDITKLEKIDAFSFGFPCNDYSIVGESKGLEGEYGPLYSYGIKV
ncbi:DNA cytosine methyltransferase, partial [Priestia megaterium]|uniref:DNA cytosine methyltransferase n=1 Tax=Priestia megaterium TaxID=1404 RepID=UPI00300B96BF